MKLLTRSLVVGVVGFSILFIIWLKGHETGIQFDTVQGIILFGTGLAAFAYLVRILSRLTFSSFHLMRDAQERKQLTYVYLSLINENKIDESSRDIILRALFSRTELDCSRASRGQQCRGWVKWSLNRPCNSSGNKRQVSRALLRILSGGNCRHNYFA